MTSRVLFQTDMRAAGMQLLSDYVADADLATGDRKFQLYPGRPASISPPTAFPDRMSERVSFIGPTLRQRNVSLAIVVIHGLFDSKDAVQQRDAFVDGFTEFVLDRYHAAGTNTLIGAVNIDDDPNYIPDWLPPERQRSYFATIITVEGLALD